MPAAPPLKVEKESPAETKTAIEIQKTITAAAVDTSRSDEDDKAFEAAVANDLNKKKGVATTEPPKKEAAKPTTEPPKADATVDDIPEAAIDPKAAKVTPKTPPADDDEELTKATAKLSPKASESFKHLKQLKAEAEQRAARLPELEAKLAEKIAELEKVNALVKERPDPTELERYKKRVEELDEIVAKTSIADHPGFRNKYDAAIEREINQAKSYVGEANAEELAQLLRLPPSKQRDTRLNELLAETEGVSEKKLGQAIVMVDRLTTDRASELANWKENRDKMKMVEAEQSKQAALAQRARLEDAYATTMSAMADPEKGVELYRTVPGNDEWNKRVSTRAEAVKQILSSDLTPEQIAEMAALYVASKDYRTLFHAQRTALKRLQQQIAELKGSEPQLGQDGNAKPTYEDNTSMVDAVIGGLVKEGILR